MKIIQLIDYYQPQVGYQEKFIGIELKQLGHAVTVVTSDRYYPFPNFEKSYGILLGKRFVGEGRRIEDSIEVVRLRSIELPKTPLVILLGLKKTLDKLQPDLVYCHGVYSLTSYLATSFKKDIGYKLIFDSHAASFNTDFNSSLPKRLYHLFHQYFIAKKIKNSADLIFAVGDNEQKFLCDDFKIPYKSIPIMRLGVDTNLFTRSTILRSKIRKQLGFKETDIVIVYTGKFTENKDIHILCQAVKLINDPRVKLLLIGGGDKKYISSLYEIIGDSKRLVILNFVENRELPAYYSAGDLASWPGGFSISIHEALSCNLPVVIPESWNTKYLEKRGISSFKRGDINSLSKAISKLIYNKKLCYELGKRSSNYVRNELSWKKIMQSLVKILP